ncbi:MAG: RDD family protein [Undibacterium sp.]
MLPSIAGIVNVFLDESPWSVTALYFLVFLTGGLVATAVVAYEVALPYLWKGQTLGMRFFRLRQVGENRGSLTLKALLVKALASLFLFLTTFGLYYLLEALILRAGKDHRSFADIISRTDVIRLG